MYVFIEVCILVVNVSVSYLFAYLLWVGWWSVTQFCVCMYVFLVIGGGVGLVGLLCFSCAFFFPPSREVEVGFFIINVHGASRVKTLKTYIIHNFRTDVIN